MLEIIKLVPHMLKVYLETSLYKKNVFLYQKGKKAIIVVLKYVFTEQQKR
jgi:hypothetical protein